MSGTGWLDDREQRAWRALNSIRMPLETALNRQLAMDCDLSTADYAVLVALSEVPGNRLRARDLGRTLGWEKSRLSHQLRRMQGRDLVSRSGCDSDGRAAYIALTGAGEQALHSAAPGHVRAVRQLVIDALSPDQLDQLAAIGESIATRLSQTQCPLALLEQAGEEADGDLLPEDQFAGQLG